MEGDDELLAEMNVKAAPVRDEWMTSLPPERRVLFFFLQMKIYCRISFFIYKMFMYLIYSINFTECLLFLLQPGGVSMQSTTFSKTGKEGRGDTSAWTETPSDRAQKAKMRLDLQ